jgi:gluconate 2-dehydrogenase gamma chain
MGKAWDVSRRHFLGLLGMAGFSTATTPLSSVTASRPDDSARVPATGMKILTARQVATLEAVAEQIIPRDSDPGAKEAGAVNYIDGVLAGYQSERQPLYAAGIEGIDETSQLIFGRNFVDLEFNQQTRVLKSLEDGSAQGEIWKSVSSQEFFALVWNHVLEGFYGPPSHGGNKDYASWKMVGFPEHSGTM